MKIFERITKYILSICTVFTLFNVTPVYATDGASNQNSTTYKQIKKSDNPTISSGFKFQNGINTSVDFSKVAYFKDTKKTVHNAQRGIKKGEVVTVVIPDGFKYLDGSTYDIEVDVTPDKDLASNSTWMCMRKDSGEYHCLELSPFNMSGWSSDPYVGFSYKLKIVDPDNPSENVVKTKGIDLTAGSCWTARNEGARPFGNNNTIYTNIPESVLQWEETITANRVTYDVHCWHITNDAYNRLNYYILGSGTNDDGSIQGGYIRSTAQGGSAEMMFGYFLNFEGKDYVGYYDGKAHGITVTPGENQTITYSETKDGNYTSTNPTYTDVGTHTVYYKVSGATSDTDVHTGTVTIKALPVVIPTTAKDKVYDGNTSVTINDVTSFKTGVGNEAVDVKNIKGKFTDKNVNKNISIKFDENPTVTAANSDTKTSNYIFTVETPTASITAKDVYVYPTAKDRNYIQGDTSATILGDDKSTANRKENPISVEGCIDGESLSVYGLTGTFADDTAGVNKPVTVQNKDSYSVIEGDNTKKSNYNIHISDTAASIGQATQDLHVSAYVGVYDGEYHNITVDGTYIKTVEYFKDAACTQPLNSTTDTNYNNGYKNVGTYTIYFKVTDTNSSYKDKIGSSFVMIVPRPLTITLTAEDKVYDGNTTATLKVDGSYSTGVDSESVTLSNVVGTFESKDVATNINVNVSKYDVAPGTNTLLENYDITVNSPTASISPRTVTITPVANNKVYDGTNSVIIEEMTVTDTNTGIVEGESVKFSDFTGAFASADAGEGISVTVDSGYTIEGLNGTKTSNYTFTVNNTSANITPKPITVTPTANDKTYDGTTSVTINDVNDLSTGVGDETISVTGFTGSFSSKDAGQNISVNSVSGTVAYENGAKESNYTITYGTPTANINKKTIDVYPAAQSKKYDGNNTTIIFGDNHDDTENSETNTIAAVGCIDGESVVVYGLKGQFDNVNASDDPINVTITNKDSTDIKKVSGKDTNTNVDNYNVVIHDTQAYIYKADQEGDVLQVYAYVGIYDGQPHMATVKGDYVSSVKFYSDSNLTTEITGYTDVSDNTVWYSVTDTSANYANKTGKTFVNIYKRNITLTPTAKDKVYNGNTDVTVNDISATKTGVGSETISVSGLKGAFDSKDAANNINITLSSTGTISYTNGAKEGNYNVIINNPKAAITPKPITVTPTAEDRVYNGEVDAKVNDVTSYKTGVNEETISVSGLSGTFSSKDAGKDKKVTVNQDNKVITPGDGTTLSNYTITIADTTATIQPLPLTIKPVANDKVYDGNRKAEIDDITGYKTGVKDESVNITNITGKFDNKNVGDNKTVTIDSESVTAGDNTNLNNYVITYDNPTASITPKEVTISADSFTINKGDKLPTLTYRIDQSQVVSGDSIGEFTPYVDGTYTEVGIYPINIKATNTNSNYTYVYKPGRLVVKESGYKIFEDVIDYSDKFTEAKMANDLDDLYSKSDKIFTSAEKEAFESGESHWGLVWLEITDTDLSTIPSNKQDEIKQLAIKEVGENPQLYYFDANMYKMIDNNDPVEIKDAGEGIIITVKVPNELINSDSSMIRKYKIIRYHTEEGQTEGVVDSLDTYFDEEKGTITFKTSKFSSFALAYADTKKATKPIDCEATKGKNYTWSDSKQACVYKVTNTSQK